MENHDTSTINSSARYCLAKPGDKVRITKTHRAGIHQYAACEGDAPIFGLRGRHVCYYQSGK